MRKRWDGLMVAKQYWEPRHPQDFAYSHRDQEAVMNARPRPADDVRDQGWVKDEAGDTILDEVGIPIYEE